MKFNKLNFDNFNYIESKSKDLNIDNSKKIISILKEKVSEFNLNNKNRVNINQFKKIYRHASRNKPKDTAANYHEYAIAKVNAFISVLSNKRKFNLSLSSKKKIYDSFLIESSIEPLPEDYEENKLNIYYSNPEDLYLEDEEDVITFNY
jgi:hypothetical protein